MGFFSWIAQDTNKPIYITGYQKQGYEQRTYYTDEHLKWGKPLTAVCLLIDLSVTLPLNI